MTPSHHWFITNIWKSDHHLNMTLGTDIKFTFCFLCAKSLCWWKWILSYFKTKELWSEDNLNTNGGSLSSDGDSDVLSVSHTLVTSTFQGQLLLSNCCWTGSFCSWFMLLIALPLCPNEDWRECMHECSLPEGIWKYSKSVHHVLSFYANTSQHCCDDAVWYSMLFIYLFYLTE